MGGETSGATFVDAFRVEHTILDAGTRFFILVGA
jgi:hypothetical protein